MPGTTGRDNDDITLRSGGQPLAAVYDAHADRLYRYGMMLLANTADAEDAVHQVFAKLVSRQARIGGIDCMGSYLLVAMRNECYRILLARRNVARVVTVDSATLLVAVESDQDNPEERKAVAAAMQSLPAEQREVVHLKLYEEITFQAIADLLGISPNTAASRYRYALGKLRATLERALDT